MAEDARGDPIDPSMLTCSDFLSLASNPESDDLTPKKLQFTFVGYWLVGYINGYITADGYEGVVRIQERGAGAAIKRICSEKPRALLSSVAAIAADQISED